jgi:hypothetical protein
MSSASMSMRQASFARSVRDQIAQNRSRTPDQRLTALCDLLDVARAMAPSRPDARERRLRSLADRQLQREQLRAQQ